MKTSLLYFLIITSIAISCKGDAKKVISDGEIHETITIPEVSVVEKEAINRKQIIKDTKIIKLETTKESIVGSIQDIKIYNDHIYILDILKSKSLFEFDLDGKFIRKYGHFGKGPEEYLVPMAFDINEKKKEVVIYDRAKKTLLKYDLNGKFKEVQKIRINTTNFLVNSNNEGYVFDTHLVRQKENFGQYALIQIDAKGNNKAKLLETNKAENGLAFMCPNSLYEKNNLILFNKPFDNIIYKLTEGGVQKMFEFKFNGKTIPLEMKRNIQYTAFKNKLSAANYEYLNGNAGFFLTSDRLLFSIKRGAATEDYVYNLKTKKLNLIKPLYKGDDLALFGIKKSTYKNSVVSYAETSWFINTELYNSKEFENTPVQNLINKTKEGDNPIIIMTTIKE